MNYIGATGFTKLHEVKHTNYFLEQIDLLDYEHVPMMGFLVSDRTLAKQETENKRYPKIDDVPYLMKSADSRVYRTVHYNTHDPETLSQQIEKLLLVEDSDHYALADFCDGVQLNMQWPKRSHLEKIMGDNSIDIILQVSAKSTSGMSPEDVAKKTVKDYGNVVTNVLFDPSGGTGKSIDLGYAVQMGKLLGNACYEFGVELYELDIGFAGGFGPENVMENVRELSSNIGSNFSIDAESGLRRRLGDGYGNDEMVLEKVRNYFFAAKKGFDSAKGEV